MIKSSSSSLKKFEKMNTSSEHLAIRRNAYQECVNSVNKSFVNKHPIRSILLKSFNTNQRQVKQIKIVKYSQPSIAISKVSRKGQNKKGLRMVSKNKYHKLSSGCLNFEKHSRFIIKGNHSQNEQRQLEKSWKSYFSSNPNRESRQFNTNKKPQIKLNDKFLHVLTHLNDIKKQNKGQDLIEKERKSTQQLSRKIQKIPIKSKLLNQSLRNTYKAELQVQTISAYLKTNEAIKSRNRLQALLKPKMKQQTNWVHTNQKASTKIQYFNPQTQINIKNANLHFQGSKMIRFPNSEIDNNHSKYSATNKMCSTRVSNDDVLQDRSISPDSKIQINQLFLRNFDIPLRVSTIYQQQSTDHNQKSDRQLLLQNYESFAPIKKNQKLDSQKRLLWKSKGSCSDAISLKTPNATTMQKMLTPLKEPQDQGRDTQEKYKTNRKQESKFKVLRNRIIESLNEVRTVETKADGNGSVTSSNKKIEESVILFKGSSDIQLNQRLAQEGSASPYKKKLAVRLSYSSEKESHYLDSMYENPSRFSFLKFRKDNKISQEQIQDDLSCSEEELKTSKLQSGVLFKLNSVQMIESADQQQVSTIFKQIERGNINHKNLKEVYEQLSYVLEKQYRRQQRFEHTHVTNKQIVHSILQGFLIINGSYQLNYNENLIGKSLQQLNGILMMELCCQIREHQRLNRFFE